MNLHRLLSAANPYKILNNVEVIGSFCSLSLVTLIESGDYDNGFVRLLRDDAVVLGEARVIPGESTFNFLSRFTGLAVSGMLLDEQGENPVELTIGGPDDTGVDLSLVTVNLVVDFIITDSCAQKYQELMTVPRGPRVFVSGTVDPSTGLPTLDLATGANIQNAINGLTASTHIRLARGGTYNQEVNPCNKPGVDRVVLGYQGAALTSEQRQRAANVNNLPTIIPLANRPAILATGANQSELPHNWTIRGINIVAPNTTDSSRGLIQTTDLANPSSLNELPHGWIVEQCYISGGASINSWNRAGISLSGQDMEVRSCRIENIFYQLYPFDTGYDSQAVRFVWGAGRARVYNTFCAASHEHIATGSSGTFVDQFRISDVEIDKCHLYRPPTWRGVHASKNPFEMKHGTHWKITRSVLENSWQENQIGPSFELYSGGMWWNALADIEIHQCWGKNNNGLFGITDRYSNDPSISGTTRRIKIHQCVNTGIADPTVCGIPPAGAAYPHFGRLASSAGGFAYDIEIERNFGIVPTGYFPSWLLSNVGAMKRVYITNNVGGTNGGTSPRLYFSSAGNGKQSFEQMNVNGDCKWEGNFMQCVDGSVEPNESLNTYVAEGSLGLVDDSTAFNNAAVLADLADLKLGGGSPGLGVANDGGDPGPDIDALITALTGVAETANLPT